MFKLAKRIAYYLRPSRGMRNTTPLLMRWSNSPKYSILKENSLFLWRLLQVLGIIHVTHTYFFDVSMAEGPSMYPLFNSQGDVILYEKLTTRFRNLRRGDVVICISPVNPEVKICKRVIAIAGDSLYVEDRRNFISSMISVPPGHLWLEGDNPDESHDSRHYGSVSQCLIVGRVILRLWPLYRTQWINTHLGPESRKRFIYPRFRDL